jgi:hypothetical protein
MVPMGEVFGVLVTAARAGAMDCPAVSSRPTVTASATLVMRYLDLVGRSHLAGCGSSAVRISAPFVIWLIKAGLA